MYRILIFISHILCPITYVAIHSRFLVSYFFPPHLGHWKINVVFFGQDVFAFLDQKELEMNLVFAKMRAQPGTLRHHQRTSAAPQMEGFQVTYKAIFCWGLVFPYGSLTNTAYIGEDSSILGT